MQKIIKANGNYSGLDVYLKETGVKKILLVCDDSIGFLKLDKYFDTLENRLGIKVIRFNDFKPNPLYESAVKGVEVLKENGCELITAVGGGSAIDTAKCIKLYSNMDPDKNYLEQKIVPNEIKLLAVPTTAGTGSEATKYAVLYYNGEKQSITHESCIPEAVLFDVSTLKTLPAYQKKATMMDAFCHGIESFWSVNSNDESKEYSKKAVSLIMDNMEGYLLNDDNACENMLKAANLAGKAINITQTTAGHAMCYKLTSLYNIAHGHAALLCDIKLFPYMQKALDDCIDPRGKEHIEKILAEISKAVGCDSIEAAFDKLASLSHKLELYPPENVSEEDIEILKNSVNPVRLKNHPVSLTVETIEKLYREILNVQGELK